MLALLALLMLLSLAQAEEMEMEVSKANIVFPAPDILVQYGTYLVTK